MKRGQKFNKVKDMPARNSVKQYLPESFYHLYNRGVEKRNIFMDKQDYSVFLGYLRDYLSDKDFPGLRNIFTSASSTAKEKYRAQKLLALKNFFERIDLLCFALMPNHFHFLVRQKEANDIDSFINCVATRYAVYFNRKYKRVGHLYQGTYKAVLIGTDEQLLHLSRYIHLNPSPGASYPSSLDDYLGKRRTLWLKTHYILSYFNRNHPRNNYGAFMGEKFSSDSDFIAPSAIDYEDQ